ncbi:amidase [Dehalococcoidia bacterium]|nr:amidase [Dehalococcoidia bacterium]
MNEPIYSSARSIARAIRERKISAVEVVEAHLARIDIVNASLNAVVRTVPERALAEARDADMELAAGASIGPLHGVPMTVKDSHDTEGVISTAGTIGRALHVPDRDSTAVARMRAAGAIMLGKTNTPELTLSLETDNLVYGRTNNPYDLSRTPGGSSGGAAAIIAAGGSPLDLGTDTGGSIRVPAGLCGIVGLKPTSGRVPRTGHIVGPTMGVLDSLTVIGPMARYVEDLELTFPIITGPDWTDPHIVPAPIRVASDVEVGKLKLVYYANNGAMSPTAEVEAAIVSASDALRSSGVTIVEHCPSVLNDMPKNQLLTADGGAVVRRMLELASTTEPAPYMSRFLGEIEPLSVEGLTALLEELDVFRSRMLSFMESYDAILCPVLPFAAPPHGQLRNLTGGYTSVFNITGWPVAVVRAGTSSEGLPIGVQIVARPWREDVCLAMAAVVESALGGWHKPEL